jgi:hypothetical protein
MIATVSVTVIASDDDAAKVERPASRKVVGPG